ncbi:hypothetical protein [Ectobacillus antri]|uniref:hypothetical protein n=1 Tax=Ectobacillus antri TaxID=2486280 RepID=UPI00301479D7
MYDVSKESLQKGCTSIEKSLQCFVKAGRMCEEEAMDVFDCIAPMQTLQEACQ